MPRAPKSLEEVIDKFISIHGDTYDYSRVHEDYKNSESKVTIICKIHGPFKQQVSLHNYGNNCKKCAMKVVVNTRPKQNITHDEFLRRSIERHGDKYDYSKSVYVEQNQKVTIICPIHGEFKQSPRHHWNSKGCYKCGRDTVAKKLKSEISKEHFIKLSTPKQVVEYDYSLVPDIVQTKEKVKIICPSHGEFEQLAQNHIYGHGCNQCCFRGHSRSDYINHCKRFGYEKSQLYLIRIYNDFESFIKIGITATGVKRRFRKMKGKYGYDYEILFTVESSPENVWDLERFLKSKYIHEKYSPSVKIIGHSECLNESCKLDVLKDIEMFTNPHDI